MSNRDFNSPYVNNYLEHIAYPLGGIGAGMICLEGTGALSHVSLRHHPNMFYEPLLFAALFVNGSNPVARVLEGPVPAWKIYGPVGSGNGLSAKHYGLSRCSEAVFDARFPFAEISLSDSVIPLEITVTGWSPFIPGDADNSSLPAAMLEYAFCNPTTEKVSAVFSFHAGNFMAQGEGPCGVFSAQDGFVLRQDGTEDKPWDAGAFMVAADDTAAVNCRWFRGNWFDARTMLWQDISAGRMPDNGPVTEGKPSPGGSLFVPLELQPGEIRTISLRMCWYVPLSDLRRGAEVEEECQSTCQCGEQVNPDRPAYRPWYAAHFADIEELADYWRQEADNLRRKTVQFSDCFYDNTLPPEVTEAIAANLTILKSPTVLRQDDGRLWCWEGCCEEVGCCSGSCTHVWNYAQAVPHLFPDLERTLRLTEFNECQDERGHQGFRAPLPIRPVADHIFYAAADGQLGGIMKIYREWRISGDTDWLCRLWPKVKRSLDYCIATWDPEREGLVIQPHHNTYDIEFHGPDGMCSSFYLGALTAAVKMAEVLGEDASGYEELALRSRRRLEDDLFNGEYFIQHVIPGNTATSSMGVLGSCFTSEDLRLSPEDVELIGREGPKYQYGGGCLSDGVLGSWMADVCGLGSIMDEEKVKSHLLAVHRYNLKHDFSTHANPQRPGYALGREGGLLLCTWPHGGKPSLPFVYSEEVWTGIEYQVASHLIRSGRVEEGLQIVKTARSRYDGRIRNPFNEYECGHWYGRALS
ncbi:MAG: GH116 family glycosyl hydrolase, partial [bacterium]|nr:GH116 family glycosyl hydrolase [bacterium]